MGTIYVAGIGPGNPDGMTLACRAAIERADVLVGYTQYIALVQPLGPDKPVFATPMRGEAARCKKALELAAEGRVVTLVCSGDAGVYGMAGLLLELAGENPAVSIEIVPGVTAALSAAASLGAPLTNDFAVVSLSDLLTPWAVIERRLACAAMADFCIALYNPASGKRTDHLARACDILLAYKPPATVCGIAQHIGRPGTNARVLTLDKLRDARVDMFSTVLVGGAETRLLNGRMVTPRGYCLG